MIDINESLAAFSKVVSDPAGQLEEHLATGKPVVGVGPYYVPEEIVYAAGGIPFGVWGRTGSVSKAAKYMPPFYCSICQMTLEMGLNHELDKLAGYMTSALCDTQRGFTQNFRVGVNQVPIIYVSQPQNRTSDFALKYAMDSYGEVKRAVQEICDAVIEDDALWDAIRLYNCWRKEMRRFIELAGKRPYLVSASQRSDVISAGYFMDKAKHLRLLEELDTALAAKPEDSSGFNRVVLTGIFYDIPAIKGILDDSRIAVVADDIEKESRQLSLDIPEDDENPICSLARAFCGLENDSILYDPKKSRINHVVSLAKDNAAQGIILFLAKFCDPEEFDVPMLAHACREANIPFLQVEVDQTTQTYEQARTQIETFVDIL